MCQLRLVRFRLGKGEESWAVEVEVPMDSLVEGAAPMLAEESSSVILHCVVVVGRLAKGCGCSCG